jgi:peptidoglycan/LPS O-acetylase OafA/YrhL
MGGQRNSELPHTRRLNYRPEIDGLRAIAVLSIILFHAGFRTFSGGFVGVDVFFVISGYLITLIIISEKDNGAFSLVRFYERRARRILPALFLVMLLTVILSWWWLSPSDMRQFSKSVVSVTTFSSNFFFWQHSGYFDRTAESNPLIHTWSLAVEEQFYLFFPIFLLIFWRYGVKVTSVALLAFGIASLSLAEWGSWTRPVATFYLLPTRGWELLLGALAAIYLYRQTRTNVHVASNTISEVACLIGFILILYPILIFSSETPVPGVYGLLPTVGTLLIIVFGTKRTVVTKILSWRILVFVGLISYSAYLFHQPIFAFARAYTTGEPSKYLMVILVAATIILATLTWHWVERPFRNQHAINRKTLLTSLLLASVFFLSAGAVGSLTGGFRNRQPPNVSWEGLGDKVAALGYPCERKRVKEYEGVKACYFGSKDSEVTIAVHGDSHVEALLDQLNVAFGQANIRGVWVRAAQCEVVPGVLQVGRNSSRKCERSWPALLRFLEEKSDGVIVASRWTFRLFPIPGQIETLTFDNGEGGADQNSLRQYMVLDSQQKPSFTKEAKASALVDFVKSILSLNKRLWLVYPIPEIGWNIFRLNWSWYNENSTVLQEISIPHEKYRTRNQFVIETFDSIPDDKNLLRIRPDEIFCDSFLEDRCVAQYKGLPYYYDSHLSDAGAKLVVDEIMQGLRTSANQL